MRTLTKNNDDRLLTRDVILVMVATFCFMASNMLATPLMAGYSEHLGASGALMGVVSGMMNIVALFCRPIAGNLADRTSKRMLVGVGSALYLVASIWYSLATSPASLIAARMVNGVGFACCSVCLATWMSLLLPIRHMGAGMGLYGTMNALAMAIGPAIGIKAQQVIGYRHTFLISAVVAVFMVVSVLFVRNGGRPAARKATPPDRGAKTGRPPRRFGIRSIVEPRVVPLSLVFMLYAIPYFATQSFLVSYTGARRLAVEVSLFFPLYAIALLIMRITLRDLFDTKGFRFFMRVCSLLMLATLLCLDLTRNDLLLVCAAILMAGSYGIMSSVTQSQAVIIAGKARSGIANSTYYAGIDLGMSLGPIIGGFLYGNMPITWFYPLFMLAMPLAWVLYLATAGYTTPSKRP
ncbi:MFS transporter [Bifidobacterium sp. 82T24]|uniref:MFS transporter n=1 Tax=Bifidobacterium pluvialisilvae TaxID=2834436 RepID=UPI001C59978A|nr:MFS transporter [Bifidobacterium pluvialisilvae]MBW3088246.1 MFS transporter [Bifidobacterium pluvialisilvae]